MPQVLPLKMALDELGEAIEAHERLHTPEEQIDNFVAVMHLAVKHREALRRCARFCRLLRDKVVYLTRHPTSRQSQNRRRLLHSLALVNYHYQFRVDLTTLIDAHARA